ncbi:unnamed protein product [Rhizoctonia solani]|uniref:Uncharacterized protein n=1 Tax=Rhizoctonia solani TaxID=456999 RepID=A0A8H2WX41_9AGAM|nr:unnamed protein product [Rhizoctonia solani]
MATLARIQNLISSRRNSPTPSPALLDAHVPSPFPSLPDRYEQTGELLVAEPPGEPVRSDIMVPPTLTLELAEQPVEVESRGQQEILPSLLAVEQSSLMALNNLFAGVLPDENWRPIVPPRRHSLPSLAVSNSQSVTLSDSTPLFTLVSNLRLQNVGDVMVQASDEHDALLCELEQHIERCSELMDTKDARLARLLVTLLQFSSKLATLTPLSASLSPPSNLAPSVSPNLSGAEVYNTLSQQASNIQLRLQDSKPGFVPSSSVSATEKAMLWARVNHVLGEIQTLCHDRTVPTPFFSPYHSVDYDRTLPPEYDHDEFEANPPVYETPSQPFVDFAQEKEKRSFEEQSIHQGAPSHRESIVSSEKMKLDLDSVMMAIDRLYLVAPQLSNQRVELKGRKLEQMEFARVAGAIEKLVDTGRLDDQRATYRPNPALRKGKQRLEDQQDLDQLMSLIGQAASRTLDSQTVFVDDMQARVARARQRDDAKRDAFVTQLAQHSSHGRLHAQDAVFSSPPKERDYSSNLNSGVSDGSLDSSKEPATIDPNAMMTLPEFVKSHPGPPPKPPSPVGASNPGNPRLLKKSSKLGLQGRGRSNSAPPLAWLTGKTSSPRSPLAPQIGPSNVAQMNITYVAEYRESLGMVAVQLRVDGLARTSRLEAEIASNFDQSSLILRCGSTTLPSLPLPSHVPVGKVDLFAASMGKPLGAAEYLDLKLPTVADVDGKDLENDLPPLLDAEQLRTSQPASFACSSCSLPVTHGLASGNVRYSDLPSEHWTELLDAWMCHPDQQVTAKLAKQAEGIWPMPGQVLVGGAFLLFDSTMVNAGGLVDSPEKNNPEWRPLQCICGAFVGHRHERPEGITYRFKKYTVRPIAVNHRFPRIPFTAFVAADMVNLAQAHASYRFVIQDEETETPRILMWLFKSAIQLSYAGAAGSLIPASGTITAAKVTFVIFGPRGPAK